MIWDGRATYTSAIKAFRLLSAAGAYRRGDEKAGYKIRTARMERIPYMLVIAGKYAETDSVSVCGKNFRVQGIGKEEK